MRAKEIKVGEYYYYGHLKKRFKCIKANTIIEKDTDKNQSDFVDYKKSLFRLYNEDMHIDKYNKV
jgi:hypothetical protein